nr:hypothetical protein [Arthrobacter sp. PAMC25284]
MSAAETTTGWTTIQRVILPSADQTDTVPLYVDAGTASGIRLRENDELARTPKLPEEKLQMFSSGGQAAHFEDLLGRHSMRVRSGEQISFGTYFNAFPASYWRRWTSVRDIRLVASTRGTGTVTVYKSNARGSVQRVDGRHVDGTTTSVFELSLKPFGDGGWYWFDLAASSEELVLENAQWETTGGGGPRNPRPGHPGNHHDEQAGLLSQQRPHPGRESRRPSKRQGNPDRGPGHAEGRG